MTRQTGAGSMKRTITGRTTEADQWVVELTDEDTKLSACAGGDSLEEAVQAAEAALRRAHYMRGPGAA